MKMNNSRMKFSAFFLAGALAFQIYGCTSPEYTTARTAMKSRDWPKAQSSLEKELAKNPAHAEAWFDLSEVHRQTGNVMGMISALEQAEKHATKDELRKKITAARFTGWIEAYNSGISAYSRYSDNNTRAVLDSAIAFVSGATRLKPEYPETYSFLGRLQEASGDTARAIETYNAYARSQQPALDFLAQNNLYAGSPREAVIQALGNPVSTQGRGTGTPGDSLLVDVFKTNGQDVYIFSASRERKPFALQGLRVNPPAGWLQQEYIR